MAIKSNSGFEWDEVNRIPTARESVWETYMKAHPEAEKFRKRSLLHYDLLHELCANISATGEYALTSNFFSQSDTSFPQASPPRAKRVSRLPLPKQKRATKPPKPHRKLVQLWENIEGGGRHYRGSGKGRQEGVVK